MTTLVAIKDHGRVHIGSDSQATLDRSKTAVAGGKISSTGRYTYGVAGLAEMMFRLQRTEWPTFQGEPDKFVVDTLIPFLLDTQTNMFKEFGIDEDSENPFQQVPRSVVLLALAGEVYELYLEKGLTPLKREDGKYAVGSGSVYARGALNATSKTDRKVVLNALEAAAKNDLYTSGPFVIKTVR